MFGLWMRVSIARAFEVSPKLNFALPILLIVTGAVMMFIGVIACFCSSTDSSILLYILSGIFFIIFGLILTSSIGGYVYRDYLKTELHKSLNQSLEEYGTQNLRDRDLDRVQHHVSCSASLFPLNFAYSSNFIFQFECCGVNGRDDWSRSPWHEQNPNHTFPDSCCRSLKACDNNNPDQVWSQGCFDKMVELINQNLSSFGFGTLLISLFQLCGVALAICLANHINKAQYEEMY